MTLRFLPDQIEQLPIAQLKPYAKNARTHSEDQVAKIAGLLVEFGWTSPLLLADDGEIIAGHGRLLAAQYLGLTEVPVIRLSHLTPDQVRACRISDNRSAELAGWDNDLLGDEMHVLNAAGYDLALTCFDGLELDRLLAPLDEEATDGEEAAPEPPADPVSRPGDLWLLGEHRLLCGDSTSADDVARLLGGDRPHLMVCDPPYGVAYDPEWRKRAGVNNSDRMGRVSNDDRADWREAWALFPGDIAYVWHGGIHGKTVAESLEACGFTIRAQVVWSKNRFALSRGHYHWQHEPCFYAVRDGGDSHWQGARDQSTIWEIALRGAGDEETVHGTQKPIECMLRPILNNSTRGDLVYEPFSGSGTTIAAAERSGRRCLAMELDPAYVDGGGMTYLQARTANEVLKAQERRLRVEKLKGQLVDVAQVRARVFRFAREERDAWLNWPNRVAAVMAADLGIDARTFHAALDAEVRRHLGELAEAVLKL